MKIDNTEVWGFRGAIRGARNPMNSWDRMDSTFDHDIIIGPNDLKLCQSLVKAGPEHAKFMRMIHVQADFTLPRCIWGEFDTYKFVEKNSQSTIHKLLNTSQEITIDMFETDYVWNEFVITSAIDDLEKLRKQYAEVKSAKDVDNKSDVLNELLLTAKMILPESYLQMRTIDTNYAELRNMYFQRRNHKMPHWHRICDWIKSLPYGEELITLEK